jgi:hypothetical protein
MMNVMQAVKHAARPALLAAALVALSPPAQAQNKPTAGALAAAHELIEVTGATTLFNPLIAGVVEQAKILYLQQNPALAKDLNEIAAKLRTDFAPRFSELTDKVAELYAEHFTEQELKDILAFYRSPVGKKMLAEQPKVVEDSMKFAQTWANKLTEEAIAKMRVELKKKGHPM